MTEYHNQAKSSVNRRRLANLATFSPKIWRGWQFDEWHEWHENGYEYSQKCR